MSENDLKKQVLDSLTGHFTITPEFEGLFEFEGERRKVFVDFLLEPSSEIINNYDMPKGKYIVEAKYLKNLSIPELSDLFIQCLTYKNSKFHDEYPVGVFIYTNLDYTFHPETMDSRMLEIMLCTFGKVNIGRLELSRNDFTFLLHKGDILFRFKNNEYKKVRRDLLSISFGSGNNKLTKKY
mgnify:CR=1 FL=1